MLADLPQFAARRFVDAVLTYDTSGLVVDYPGIATRHA
jgi:hypothetical protein